MIPDMPLQCQPEVMQMMSDVMYIGQCSGITDGPGGVFPRALPVATVTGAAAGGAGGAAAPGPAVAVTVQCQCQPECQ
jgi:hypothetical protein